MFFRILLLLSFVPCYLGQNKLEPLDLVQSDVPPNEIHLPHFSTHADDETVILTEMLGKSKSLAIAAQNKTIPTFGGAADEKSPAAEEFRLPKNLAPLWYNLTIKTYLPGYDAEIPSTKNKTFEGTVLIAFRVLELTRQIELNALNLKFDEQKLEYYRLVEEASDGNQTSDIKVEHITLNQTLEKVKFDLSSELRKGALYYFSVPYTGFLWSGLSGLYLTKYSVNGKEKYAATTHMEPADARRMLPCFDEPSFKAIFRLNVIHPSGTRAISNGIELKETETLKDDKQWLRTEFSETPRMSSYLLALVVSEFDFLEGHTSDGKIRVRVWAQPNEINSTNYALKAGIKVLEYYSSYYEIPFPIQKMDMIAIPDFSAGAMENWGLVTYCEKCMLCPQNDCAANTKLAVAHIVAHELGHQWFGNLVTMKWWNDLWLNEGFATLVSYFGTNAAGDFRINELFPVRDLRSAFLADSSLNSHPISFDGGPGKYFFDSITYAKGGSVLRMIMNVMGEENFRKGLVRYLNAHKYGNTEGKDLWDSLNEAVPLDLTDWSGNRLDLNEFTSGWFQQSGYPILSVKRLDSDKVELTQQRFLVGSDRPETWKVPLWLSINGTEQKSISWLSDHSSVVHVPEDVALIINTGSRGFYRIRYCPETLGRVTDLLLDDHLKVSLGSRIRLIDDAFTFAKAGQIKFEAALNLTRYLNSEVEYAPWAIALSGLSDIRYLFAEESEGFENFRTYFKYIVKNLAEKELSRMMDQEFHEQEKYFHESQLNYQIVQWVCTIGDSQCVQKLREVFREHFVQRCQLQQTGSALESSECSTVPLRYRSMTYCMGIRYGMESDWETMLDFYLRESSPSEKERLLTSLACSRDVYTLKKLLLMASTKANNEIPLERKAEVYNDVVSHSIGKEIVPGFLLDNWLRLYREFNQDPLTLNQIIRKSIVGSSRRLIDQVEKFLTDNESTTKNFADSFRYCIENMRRNRQWLERHFLPLNTWLIHHGNRL